MFWCVKKCDRDILGHEMVMNRDMQVYDQRAYINEKQIVKGF